VSNFPIGANSTIEARIFVIAARMHSALICCKIQVYDVMVEYNN